MKEKKIIKENKKVAKALHDQRFPVLISFINVESHVSLIITVRRPLRPIGDDDRYLAERK